jgi:polyphenol oxidase
MRGAGAAPSPFAGAPKPPGPGDSLSAVNLPAPFRWETDHIAADLPGARLVFSTRLGGVSDKPFDSLNLGLLTDDAPENVRENRRRLGDRVGHPWERFCYGRQVHGATVRRATEPPSAERPYAEEDGQATALTDAAAIVFVADCLPVLLAAPGGVAALHCGWRPLDGGIVAEGIKALREVGGDGEIQAAIGPGARGCCYEVGEEVHARFARYDARHGARNLDLAKVAARQLREAGVDAVHDTGVCTICNDAFFSHRRDHGVTGRQAGVVCRV